MIKFRESRRNEEKTGGLKESRRREERKLESEDNNHCF